MKRFLTFGSLLIISMFLLTGCFNFSTPDDDLNEAWAHNMSKVKGVVKASYHKQIFFTPFVPSVSLTVNGAADFNSILKAACDTEAVPESTLYILFKEEGSSSMVKQTLDSTCSEDALNLQEYYAAIPEDAESRNIVLFLEAHKWVDKETNTPDKRYTLRVGTYTTSDGTSTSQYDNTAYITGFVNPRYSLIAGDFAKIMGNLPENKVPTFLYIPDYLSTQKAVAIEDNNYGSPSSIHQIKSFSGDDAVMVTPKSQKAYSDTLKIISENNLNVHGIYFSDDSPGVIDLAIFSEDSSLTAAMFPALSGVNFEVIIKERPHYQILSSEVNSDNTVLYLKEVKKNLINKGYIWLPDSEVEVILLADWYCSAISYATGEAELREMIVNYAPENIVRVTVFDSAIKHLCPNAEEEAQPDFVSGS